MCDSSKPRCNRQNPDLNSLVWFHHDVVALSLVGTGMSSYLLVTAALRSELPRIAVSHTPDCLCDGCMSSVSREVTSLPAILKAHK